MKIDVLLGLQWGDEGKGKIVDFLSPNYDIVARFQGGPNAGHTLNIGDLKHVLHIIPSGIFHKNIINLIGNGVIIDPLILQNELKQIIDKGFNPKENLIISSRANLIMPTHRLMDAANEQMLGKQKIGSTLKGIGPCYTDKVARLGLRVGDIFSEDFSDRYTMLKNIHLSQLESKKFDYNSYKIEGKTLQEYEEQWLKAVEYLKQYQVIDTEIYINRALASGKRVLAEGAQGTLLDIDFGTYPFVTSSNTITGGVCTGLGVPPSAIDKVYGVFKAYCTRVGSGPFMSELFDDTAKTMQEKGHEFGATTGRARRCGWLDIVALNYAVMINGVTDLIMMKVDVLDDFESISVCEKYEYKNQIYSEFNSMIDLNNVKPIWHQLEGWKHNTVDCKSYENLPKQLKDFVSYVEQMVNKNVTAISVGPDRSQTVWRN